MGTEEKFHFSKFNARLQVFKIWLFYDVIEDLVLF